MSRIRVLPQNVVNQIAAGEVIERPASVLKELLENALDAGASQVNLFVEEGGRRSIRVEDNGEGMDPENLALAFISHATSKLSADDLSEIQTLGFRGEALSSIGAVARVEMTSRRQGDASGHCVRIEGGKIFEVTPAGCAPGTVVHVEDLFFNLPARRAFLRTPSTEMRHITDAATWLALSRPGAGFHLKHGKREVFQLLPRKGLKDRIADLFGNALGEALLPLTGELNGIGLSGYIARPGQHRTSSKHLQFIFLNGRRITDRTIYQAFLQGLAGSLIHGETPPPLFLFLEADPHVVDVNVHPAKREVRFKNSNSLFQLVQGAVRDATATKDFHPRLTPSGNIARESSATAYVSTAPVGKKAASWWQVRQAPTGEGMALAERILDAPENTDSQTAMPKDAPILRRVMQAHDRVIVEETPEGLMIIDQHALHERILFEEFKARLAQGGIPIQGLMIPEVFDLSPAQWDAFHKTQQHLKPLGFEVEVFGDKAIAVSGIPATLKPSRVRLVVEALLEEMINERSTSDPSAHLDGLIETLACKAAVKAGEVLQLDEIETLLRTRDAQKIANTCPHGRPWGVAVSLNKIAGCIRRK